MSKSSSAEQRAAIGAIGVDELQAAWAELYERTTDPLVAGLLWNNAGHLVFSSGPLSSSYTPSLDFSDARNSMYITLIFQDI